MQIRPSPSCHRAAAILGLSFTLAAAAALTAHAQDYTDVKAYVVPVTPDYAIQPLLSVGDQVPNTSDASKAYQMIGIPDGLGAYQGRGDTTVLFMNHELTQPTLSEPNVGGVRQRGAFVSRFILGKNGAVISGERAYDLVYDEEKGIVLPPADETNTTPAFARFCSGDLAWKDAGFDRPIYFPGEESGGAATFDGKGGLAFALFDREIHSLPKMGRFPWENTLVRPEKGDTVVMLMEDGPTTPDNQLYMYVGPKSKARNASVLSRNGLDTGKFYAFRSTTPGKTSELNFTTGSITGEWVEIPNVETLTDVQLEAASDAIGAFGFIRIEDGAWSKTDKNKFYFVTTGNGPGNRLGRAYTVDFDPNNILGSAKISFIFNGDTVRAAGGDIAFGADNVDVSKEFLMINEDGHSDSRPAYAANAREGSIWRFNLSDTSIFKRVAELNPPGTAKAPGASAPPPVPVPGTWETSGIIDASDFFGKDSWLTVVQAHAPTLAPAPNTVEDGQLLLMVPTGLTDEDRDDDDND